MEGKSFFLALHLLNVGFTSDGGLIQTNGAFALRSSGHGIWKQTAQGHYSTKYISYAYIVDPDIQLPPGPPGLPFLG